MTIESYSAGNRKPAHRLELHFNTGVSAARPWSGVRVTQGKGCETLTGYYASPVDAADAVLDADDALPLWVPHYLKETLVSHWQIRGMNMYRNDVDFECCANSHIADGWKMLWERDNEHLLAQGWPVGEAVHA